MSLNPANIRAILFDAGNTLIGLDLEFLTRLFEEHGCRISQRELAVVEYAAREAIRTKGEGESGWTAYFRRIFRDCGLDEADHPALEAAIIRRHEERNMWSCVYPDAARTLEYLLRGYRLAVISNSDGTVERLFERTGLRDYFEFVIDSTVVGVAKPDPRIFEMALDRIGLPADETVYVGDDLINDVGGARSVGIAPILYDPLCIHTPDDPHLTTVRSLSDLCRMFPACGLRAQ